MINKNDFRQIRKQYDTEDALREKIIKSSRDILKASKHAIYSVHRGNLSEADSLLKKAKTAMSGMNKLVTKTQSLESVGAYNDAASEFCEAVCFYNYVKDGRIPVSSQVGASNENYLLGLCDSTGELARRVVMLATQNRHSEIIRIKDLVEELYGEFLKFNFRNSELRKKSDSIKWNLKKIEEVVYDLSLKNK